MAQNAPVASPHDFNIGYRTMFQPTVSLSLYVYMYLYTYVQSFIDFTNRHIHPLSLSRSATKP